MRNITVICYLFSLLSLGMGYLKMLVFENAITEHINTYDFTIDLSLAISFFVLTIFFAVLGFIFYTVFVANKETYKKAESKDYECNRPVLEASIDSLNLLTCENNDEQIHLSYRASGNNSIFTKELA
ncbi:MAG: hypothetical protein P4L69_10060 [Desulfosporosinus sp.]|nr:hypothetical protein [Desulfosporosinus sp.]